MAKNVLIHWSHGMAVAGLTLLSTAHLVAGDGTPSVTPAHGRAVVRPRLIPRSATVRRAYSAPIATAPGAVGMPVDDSAFVGISQDSESGPTWAPALETADPGAMGLGSESGWSPADEGLGLPADTGMLPGNPLTGPEDGLPGSPPMGTDWSGDSQWTPPPLDDSAVQIELWLPTDASVKINHRRTFQGGSHRLFASRVPVVPGEGDALAQYRYTVEVRRTSRRRTGVDLCERIDLQLAMGWHAEIYVEDPCGPQQPRFQFDVRVFDAEGRPVKEIAAAGRPGWRYSPQVVGSSSCPRSDGSVDLPAGCETGTCLEDTLSTSGILLPTTNVSPKSTGPSSTDTVQMPPAQTPAPTPASDLPGDPQSAGSQHEEPVRAPASDPPTKPVEAAPVPEPSSQSKRRERTSERGPLARRLVAPTGAATSGGRVATKPRLR